MMMMRCSGRSEEKEGSMIEVGTTYGVGESVLDADCPI